MPGPSAHRFCSHCGTATDLDQRYCISCGERQVELPAHVRELMGLAVPSAVVPPYADPPPLSVPVAAATPTGFRLPRPRDMAIAVLAVLGFGVVVGTAVSPAAGPAAPPYYIALTPAPAAAPAPEPAPVEDTTVDVPDTPVAAPVVAPAPAPAPVAVPAKQPKAQPTPPPPAAPTLPPIRHVFLIVLSDQGFQQSFGADSKAPYLAKTLTSQGELLTNYYAVAPGNLANAAALISGQGPTVSTTQNCPSYVDITPGTVDDDGQVIGDGCIYPKTTQTLADQLVAGGHSWKAYVQGMGTGTDGQPATCKTPPAPDAPPVDPATAATAPPDPYAPWRNPFVYFRSIVDSPLCANDDVGLEQLETDLKTDTTTPTVSYIVPDLCHNGSDTPCAPGQPAGLAQADAFLQDIVPKIMDSPAYKTGMIAITFDQAPQTGEHADSSGLANMPAYPNLPAVPADPAAAGTTPPATTPTDPAAVATTPTDPAAAPTEPTDPAATPTTPTDPAAAVPAPDPAADPGAATTPAATTPTTTSTTPATTTPTTTPTTPVDSGLPTTTTGGGGNVGLLLLSPFVKPATTSAFSYYNHFSLLKSIEDLFGLEQLGYAKIPTLSGFDATVYTNPTGETESKDG